ncbi:MAG: hydantoinase/oxoprolinase N-terminal domain-containing protein, partial [Planctomycetaceae bacterium]
MPHWEFWIDVGGTFTDCIARAPDDTLRTAKVLSSGVTKGRVESALDEWHFCARDRIGDPPNFWTGYELRILDDAGAALSTTRVRAFDWEHGNFVLEDPLPGSVIRRVRAGGLAYELASGEEAPILGIRRLLGLPLGEPIPPVTVKLGTTRGTNALLTRTGARTGFVTTRGFADVLLIANQDRPRLFDLAIEKPAPLFERVVEIDERLDAEGNVLVAPQPDRVHRQLIELKQTGVESVAICLLHAYRNAEHERLVEELARDVGFREISTSHRLAPLIKIVSRGDTTVMDAYLNPVLREYVGRLRQSLGNAECGMRNAECGVRSAELESTQHAALSTQHSAP